jgi:hypothetical protein
VYEVDLPEEIFFRKEKELPEGEWREAAVEVFADLVDKLISGEHNCKLIIVAEWVKSDEMAERLADLTYIMLTKMCSSFCLIPVPEIADALSGMLLTVDNFSLEIRNDRDGQILEGNEVEK